MRGKPLLIILGPTAIGKTGLAIQLAQMLNGEIIGADSRQIYKYMNIGTAKPTIKECQAAQHHLIDFIEPDETLTLAQYQEQAYATIELIHNNNKLPIMVGGTGQYITAVEEGWSIPRVPPNYELRRKLEEKAKAEGKIILHNQLEQVDPEAAANIHPNNVRRVIRALEVYLETSTPISVLQRKSPPPYKIIVIGLKMEREPLYKRADQRLDQMIESGFVEEVQSLLAMGYHSDLPSMSGLGYPEIIAYLENDLSLDEAISKSKTSTHDFIRRQEVWFKGHDNGILWHNVEEIEPQALAKHIQHLLEE